MELHLHGMERSYGFESRQYPLKLNYGGVAQLVEHFVRTEEVMDSNSIAFHYGSVAKWI